MVRELRIVATNLDTLERLVSRNLHSRHSATWGDDNGFSHLRSTLMGPGITIPFHDGQLVLGTWQQIFHLECDIRPRQRTVVVTVIGE